MNIRWLWRDYIPAGLSLGELERAIIRRRANQFRPADPDDPVNRRAQRIYGKHYAPVSAMFIIWGACMMYMQIVLHRSPPILPWFGMFAVTCLGAWIASAIARGKTHAPYVCRALREMGHDVCAECGYSLKGLSATEHVRCPECGWVRDDAADSP